MTEQNSTREKILPRVRALLQRAEHEGTPEAEADACRAKAEELMRAYRIAEEEAIARDEISIEPILVSINLCTTDSKFYQDYVDLMWHAANHAGAMVRFAWVYPAGERVQTLVARMVGYETDVQHAEFLFTAAQLVFSARLEPKIDPKLSDEENIYRLRSAGITRRRVANLLWNLDTHASHAKVGAVYKQECVKRGETPALDGRGVHADTYRKAYAKQFVSDYAVRLRKARDAADSKGGALVLHSRKERVEEAFYRHFPELRPAPTGAASSNGGKPVKPRKWTKADQRRWEQANYSAAALAGKAAGRSAAAEIDLARGDAEKRLDRYTEGERETTRQIWGAIGL